VLGLVFSYPALQVQLARALAAAGDIMLAGHCAQAPMLRVALYLVGGFGRAQIGLVRRCLRVK
jgi:hypothetical protein